MWEWLKSPLVLKVNLKMESITMIDFSLGLWKFEYKEQVFGNCCHIHVKLSFFVFSEKLGYRCILDQEHEYDEAEMTQKCSKTTKKNF